MLCFYDGHRRYNYVYEKVFVYIIIGVGSNYDGVW